MMRLDSSVANFFHIPSPKEKCCALRAMAFSFSSPCFLLERIKQSEEVILN